MVERYLNNESYMDIIMGEGVTADLASKLSSTIPILKKIDYIHYQETVLFSKNLGLAGRCDLIASYEGIHSIIDFKTSRRIKKPTSIQHYFEQATAYGLMYESMTNHDVDQVVIIIATDGLPEPQVFKQYKRDYILSLERKIREYREYHSWFF